MSRRRWPPVVARLGWSSFATRFMLVGVLVLTAGMAGVGWWIETQIVEGVIHQTATTTALYMESIVARRIQELAQSPGLTPEHVAELDALVRGTPLGREVMAVKIWGAGGRVLYSSDPATVGRLFPEHAPLRRAWSGQVAAELSDLQDAENEAERGRWPELLEVYSPVRRFGSDQIVAVAEFYQTVDQLRADIAAATLRSRSIVAGVGTVMYLLLAGFVRRTGDTIGRQQTALRQQVNQLTALLAQNQLLHERVRGAAARTAAVNERVLRRISAELHDGPAQDLALALLELDHAAVRCGTCTRGGRSSLGAASGVNGYERNGMANGPHLTASPAPPAAGVPLSNNHLAVATGAIQRALAEVRAISAGLTLPQISHLTPADTVRRAVRAHEQRTRTHVDLVLGALPEQVGPAAQIALYRIVQEALANAQRHAGGKGQQVRLRREDEALLVEIADRGPGFDLAAVAADGRELEAFGQERLGLVGMRERVESLGGTFAVRSAPGQGTTVMARLPLHGTSATRYGQEEASGA